MPIPADVIDFSITPQLQPLTRGTARSTYLQPSIGDVRWRAGATFNPRGRPNLTVIGFTDVCEALPDWANPEGFPDTVTFTPFLVRERLMCASIGALSQEEINDWARDEATAAFSAALARVAMYGPTGVNAYPDLLSQAAVIGNSGSFLGALAAVEDAMAIRLLNNRFMVHMSPGSLTQLVAAGAIKVEGDRFVTAMGNTVVADAGYLPDPVAGRSRIYGSPPIAYVASELRVKGDEESFNRVHNDFNAYVTGEAFLWYDTSSVVATDVVTTTQPAV